MKLEPHFFGYGSLVNTATHDYPGVQKAALKGWRREWRHTAHRPVAFLTARPSPDTTIDGLVAAVPGSDWAALDAREYAYDRHVVTEAIALSEPKPETAVYAIPHEAQPPASGSGPILLSYLDVVVQGYLNQFGEDGVARFFETTDGWGTPILDDRANPRYPRAQMLSERETEIVDHFIAANSAS